MNRLLNTSSITGSASVPIACCVARAFTRVSSIGPAARQHRLPAGIDHGGGVLLRDDRRPVDRRAGRERFAHEQAGVEPAHRAYMRTCASARGVWRLASPLVAGASWRSPGAHRLDRHRLDHQRPTGHQEREALAVAGLERGAQFGDRAQVDHQRGVGALVAQVHALAQLDHRRGHALAHDFVACRRAQLGQLGARRGRGPASSSARSTADSRIAIWSASPMP